MPHIERITYVEIDRSHPDKLLLTLSTHEAQPPLSFYATPEIALDCGSLYYAISDEYNPKGYSVEQKPFEESYAAIRANIEQRSSEITTR